MPPQNSEFSLGCIGISFPTPHALWNTSPNFTVHGKSLSACVTIPVQPIKGYTVVRKLNYFDNYLYLNTFKSPILDCQSPLLRSFSVISLTLSLLSLSSLVLVSTYAHTQCTGVSVLKQKVSDYFRNTVVSIFYIVKFTLFRIISINGIATAIRNTMKMMIMKIRAVAVAGVIV